MQISTVHNFAFLCSPKCASTSIESAIKPLCHINMSQRGEVKHINAEMYNKHLVPLFDAIIPENKISSFCTIREPFDWIESWYKFRTRDKIKDPTNPYHKNYTGKVSYNEFIEAFIAPGQRPPYADLPSQFDFISTSEKKIGIDYLFPVDRLDLVAEFIAKKSGKQIIIPVKNMSPSADTPLDPILRRKLAEHLKDDIALYNVVNRVGIFQTCIHEELFIDALGSNP